MTNIKIKYEFGISTENVNITVIFQTNAQENLVGHSVGGLRPTLGIHVCDQASVIIKQNVVFYNHHTKMGPFSTHVWYHGTHAKEKYVAKDV